MPWNLPCLIALEPLSQMKFLDAMASSPITPQLSHSPGRYSGQDVKEAERQVFV